MVTEKTEIVKYGKDDKYRLTIPKDILIGLGWINQEKREKGANETSKEEKKRISINLISHPFGKYLIIGNEEEGLDEEKRYILLTKKGSREKGFFFKRKVMHGVLKVHPTKSKNNKEKFMAYIKKRQEGKIKLSFLKYQEKK